MQSLLSMCPPLQNDSVPYSSWTCHYTIQTYIIRCHIFPIIVTGECTLNQANEHLATGILCFYRASMQRIRQGRHHWNERCVGVAVIKVVVFCSVIYDAHAPTGHTTLSLPNHVKSSLITRPISIK